MKLRSLHTAFALVLVNALLIGCASQQDRPVVARNANGRLDAWGFTGPGGGGAMFYPAISPFDENFAFVSCDMTGSFVTKDGGNSWRMFNLRGVTQFYTFDPQNQNVVYASSIGLFRSVNAGETWDLVYPKPADVVGVVSLGDHAEEVIVTRDSVEHRVLALAVDPSDSRKLYAAIQVADELAFYSSDDQAETWKKEKVLDDGAHNIFILPSSPANDREIYVTGQSTITVRRQGEWAVNGGPERVNQITAFTGGFDKASDKFLIYAISGKGYFNPEGDESGIFFTDNGGKTWENRQSKLVSLGMANATLPEFRAIAASSENPNVVYVSYNNLKISQDTSCIGVAKSEDYGKTWKLVWKDRITRQQQTPSANMKDGWLNERFGPSWGENPFSIGVSPKNPQVCYATDFGRTIKTSSGGDTWEQVYTRKSDHGWSSRGLEVTTGYNITFDPFDSTHCFINTTDIGLMESVDGGKSWRSATNNNGIPHEWVNSCYWMVFDPAVKGKIYAAMSGTHDLPRPKMWRHRSPKDFKGGILVSEDGSKTWKAISADIGEAAITHLLLDEKSDAGSRTLYACAFGKGVYKSMDGGKTWLQKNNGLDGEEPFAWRLEQRAHDGTLFLVVARRSFDGSIGTPGDGAVYRSDDGAESWKKVELPHGTNGPVSLTVDPQNQKTLLLGAWGRKSNAGRLSADIGGGIFRSADDGKSWMSVLSKDQHIHDITYDVQSHIFYACGFNGSAYRSEDGGAHWSRIKGYNFKWGKRIVPDPIDRDKIFVITFGGGVWHGPARGDDNATEDIVTPALRFH